ncbi:MAG: hypothetical protein ACOYN0_13750 [Phycisphaerales bacterium]
MNAGTSFSCDGDLPARLDVTNLESVEAWLLAGAEACEHAACRKFSTEVIRAPGILIATGDLHDNPMHFAKLMTAAHLDDPANEEPRFSGEETPVHHLVLHELIHGERLMQGMDMSYRTLVRVAQLKALHPERVHVLLGNHELSQIKGAGILKDGVRVVEVFNEGVEYVFGSDAPRVHAAIERFVLAMPLALRCETPRGDILIAHSLPPAAMMGRFDPTVLSRDLTEADYSPRTGSAHIMVWGRGYDAGLIEDLVERWGVAMFILGHDKVEEGARFVPPNVLVLNSDHAGGVYVPIDLSDPPRAAEAVGMAVPLA